MRCYQNFAAIYSHVVTTAATAIMLAMQSLWTKMSSPMPGIKLDAHESRKGEYIEI